MCSKILIIYSMSLFFVGYDFFFRNSALIFTLYISSCNNFLCLKKKEEDRCEKSSEKTFENFENS